MLKNLKISSKIYLLGFIQIALMLMMGIVALTKMSEIGKELINIAEKDIPISNDLSHVVEANLELSVLFERALLTSEMSKQGGHGEAELFERLTKEFDSLAEEATDRLSATRQRVEQVLSVSTSAEIIDEFERVLNTLTEAQVNSRRVIEQMKLVLSEVEQNPIQGQLVVIHDIQKVEDSIEKQLVSINDEVSKFTLKAAKKAEEDEQAGIMWIWAALILSLTTGIILPFIISKAITVPINHLTSRLREVAEGDGNLTLRLDESAGDETGQVAREFNKFLAVLRTLISTSKDQAHALAESATEATNQMAQTQKEIVNQRTETDMVATAVNEMSSATQEVASNASSASETTQRVNNTVSDGQKDVEETHGIINRLFAEITESETVIKRLVNETNNIGNVLESIQGIAEQTNLLALNAAIEAARAGESGRGFAVVADEVRTLAQRTQTSTIDIQELLVRLKNEANNAVISMTKGCESAELCLQKSAATSSTFAAAHDAMGTISDLNAQIAAAAEEQSAVAEEINKNLQNISQIADSTTQGAIKTSDANENIKNRVLELQGNLNKFVV